MTLSEIKTNMETCQTELDNILVLLKTEQEPGEEVNLNEIYTKQSKLGAEMSIYQSYLQSVTMITQVERAIAETAITD